MNLPAKVIILIFILMVLNLLPGFFQLRPCWLMKRDSRKIFRESCFTFGIHPWYLDEKNHNLLITNVIMVADNPLVIAIGEAGFDKIKGPSLSFSGGHLKNRCILLKSRKNRL